MFFVAVEGVWKEHSGGFFGQALFSPTIVEDCHLRVLSPVYGLIVYMARSYPYLVNIFGQNPCLDAQFRLSRCEGF